VTLESQKGIAAVGYNSTEERMGRHGFERGRKPAPQWISA
jgi:hypothetical protein